MTSEKLSLEQILTWVQDWTISLQEVVKAIKNRAWKITIPLTSVTSEHLKLANKLTNSTTDEQKNHALKINNFLIETAEFRNNFSWITIIEKNWVRYLIIDKDNIFEIQEQKWNVYIVCNPLTKKYIVYKYLWEWLENTVLLNHLDSIEKTKIEWFYKVSSWVWKTYCCISWEKVLEIPEKEIKSMKLLKSPKWKNYLYVSGKLIDLDELNIVLNNIRCPTIIYDSEEDLANWIYSRIQYRTEKERRWIWKWLLWNKTIVNEFVL